MRRGLFIGLIVFAFIVGIIWAIGNRGGDDPVQEGAVEETALIDYANTTNNVRYIMRGKINAREEHRVLTITVGRDSRVATITEGYSGKVIKSQRLGNDSNAYEEFLAALENEGFTQARQAESSIVPEGACPKGRRFDFEIVQAGNTKQSLWTTSCRSSSGTFDGSDDDISDLFEAQLPEYSDFVKGVRF